MLRLCHQQPRAGSNSLRQIIRSFQQKKKSSNQQKTIRVNKKNRNRTLRLLLPGTGGASDIGKAKSSGEDPRATGGLVSNLPHPRVNKTKQHTTCM